MMFGYRSLNLIYSNNNAPFFERKKEIQEIVLQARCEPNIDNFGAADEVEIGRGKSYAVFPELEELVRAGNQITINALRGQLKSRGVVESRFQDKVIGLLLQSKIGLQFAMGNLLNTLFVQNHHYFMMDNDHFNIHLEVKDANKVTLHMNAPWKSFSNEKQGAAFVCAIAINITPEKIVLNDFKVTQIANDESANNAFNFLKQHQGNFLQQFVRWLRVFFNRTKNLELENIHDPSPLAKGKILAEKPLAQADADQPVEASSGFSPKL